MVTRRWLGYPLLGLALLLAVFTVANVAFAERPEDCAPEDREIPGNTNSPCKWVTAIKVAAPSPFLAS